MRFSALLLLLPLAFLAGRLTRAEESDAGTPPETVAAKRYAIVYCESALELTHGGGQWVTELFLPEEKVAATVVFESPPPEEGKPGERPARRPRLLARSAGKVRNDLVGLRRAQPSPVEDIRIPAGLAKEIVALAELTKRQRDEGLRLGRSAVERLGLKELPRVWGSPDVPKSDR